MPAPELQIGNRTAYFRKSIMTPDFTSERVLARDAFQFGTLWLKRRCPTALPYWEQARSYYEASKHLPAQSSPLTSYYCFLNAAKALLTVKGVAFAERHGIAGNFDPQSQRSLGNEIIKSKVQALLRHCPNILKRKRRRRSTRSMTCFQTYRSSTERSATHFARIQSFLFRSEMSYIVSIRGITTFGYRRRSRENSRTAGALERSRIDLRSTTAIPTPASSVRDGASSGTVGRHQRRKRKPRTREWRVTTEDFGKISSIYRHFPTFGTSSGR